MQKSEKFYNFCIKILRRFNYFNFIRFDFLQSILRPHLGRLHGLGVSLKRPLLNNFFLEI